MTIEEAYIWRTDFTVICRFSTAWRVGVPKPCAVQGSNTHTHTHTHAHTYTQDTVIDYLTDLDFKEIRSRCY